MLRENQHRTQAKIDCAEEMTISRKRLIGGLGTCEMDNQAALLYQQVIKYFNSSEILGQLNSGQLMMVDSHRRCGLIIYKPYHAEFAGPGAAIGGFFDTSCQRVIPVGEFSLVYPESYEERQKAYTIRRHWVRLTEQMTENPVPLQRAQMILTQFENYFDKEILASLPDEAFARLVGVLPQTIRMIRSIPETSNKAIALT